MPKKRRRDEIITRSEDARESECNRESPSDNSGDTRSESEIRPGERSTSEDYTSQSTEESVNGKQEKEETTKTKEKVLRCPKCGAAPVWITTPVTCVCPNCSNSVEFK